MKTKKNPLFILSLAILALALGLALFLSYPTFGGKDISFSSTYKEKEVVLKGTYWEKKGSEKAVLICPGYSCDREKWRPMANLFAANGLSVMVFDYAGQGASSSTIGFDNARTDAIPEEIDDALEVLHELSGLDYEDIILLGHSMGGRSILRLLYDYNGEDAVTRTEKKSIGAVILLSPEVNYNYNAQASLFAGTSDAFEEPWASYNASLTAGTDVYLIGSTSDDIVSDKDMLSIYTHLGGSGAPTGGAWRGETTNSVGSTIFLENTTSVLHSYMMYSPRCGRIVGECLERITGKTNVYPPSRFRLVYAVWYLSLLGLGLLFFSLREEDTERAEAIPVLLDGRAFLLRKLLLWIPGLLVAFLICSLCVAVPFGSPVMNIPYMCSIAGYGLVMLLSYRKGRFKGTEGKLPAPSFSLKGEKKDSMKALLAVVITSFFVWYVLWATMYRLIPLNFRLFWVVVASLLMTVGYYVSGIEVDMLDRAKASFGTKLLYNLIQYVALFLLVLFYLVIKSYSGLIGQCQNMILMYTFCVPLGTYVRRKTGNRLLGALVSAFLFQTLMITSAALISMF